MSELPDLPQVAVWSFEGTEWAWRGQITGYQSATVAPRLLDAGVWSLSMPYDEQALRVLADRVVTFDWRGVRLMTGLITTFNPGSDDQTGAPVLNVSGVDALAVIGWKLAYPNPAVSLAQQPYPDPTVPITTPPAPGTYRGPAETVVSQLVAGNLRDRAGVQVTLPPSQGRGAVVSARPRFDNLLELVTRNAKRGGIGLQMGLVNRTGTRAAMTLTAYQPVDLTARVRLSEKAGTLRSWSQTDTAPTATAALVGGAGDGATRVWRQVTTAASVAAAGQWGGHREVFVDGPDSFDNPELDQAGLEALDSGAATTNLSVTAAEAEGLMAFRDYNVGDKVTARLLTGVSVADVITAITVTVSDTGVDVAPAFGDPDATSPVQRRNQIIRAVRRDVKRLQTRR